VDNVQWRLDYAKEKFGDKVELINFDEHKDVAGYINEITAPGTHGLDFTRPQGIDIALECAAGEYAKGWAHKIEMAVGLETDTSEILNEMIAAVVPYGKVGVTGVYSGFVNHLK
jgi:threonine dehydrogenase-like Zn-dependent dehydrogenase